MKRGLKCDINDEDDFFDDQCGSPYSNFCSSDRKKRRGIIEKRRRDRINTSLCDLKRLVPDACNKQNSAKLEKAEILQITVDFLRRLHQEGYVLMAETRAAENRRLGFHECLTEVSRFISTQSDLPMNANTATLNVPNYIEDFKRRLINHLQVISQKRDTDMKSYLESTAQVAGEMTGTSKAGSTEHQMPSAPVTTTSANNNNTYDSYSRQNYQNSTYYNSDQQTQQTQLYSHYKDRSDTSNSSPGGLHQSNANLLNSTNLMSVSSMTSGSGPQNESQSTTSPSLVGTLEEAEMSTSGTPPNLRPSLQALMNQVYGQENGIKLDPPFECSSPTKSDFWLDPEPAKKSDHLTNGNSAYFYNDHPYNYFTGDAGSFYSGTNGYPDYYSQVMNSTTNPANFPVKQHLS